jgi:hypothetical protein
LREDVRAELGSVTSGSPTVALVSDDDDDDDDHDLTSPGAAGSSPRAIPTVIPRNVFGRAEDEVTSDFQIPDEDPAAAPMERPEHPTLPLPAWRPLTDDDTPHESEPLLDSLRRERDESSPDDERGGGQPGLN